MNAQSTLECFCDILSLTKQMLANLHYILRCNMPNLMFVRSRVHNTMNSWSNVPWIQHGIINADSTQYTYIAMMCV